MRRRRRSPWRARCARRRTRRAGADTAGRCRRSGFGARAIERAGGGWSAGDQCGVCRLDRLERPAQPRDGAGADGRLAADLVGDRERPPVARAHLRVALRDVSVERPRDVAEDLVPFPGEECRQVAAKRAARGEVEQAMTGAADLDHDAAIVGDDPGLGVGDGCSGIEEPPDDLHETVGRDRLDQIGVGAAGEAVLPSLGGGIRRGDHHDRQRGTRWP